MANVANPTTASRLTAKLLQEISNSAREDADGIETHIRLHLTDDAPELLRLRQTQHLCSNLSNFAILAASDDARLGNPSVKPQRARGVAFKRAGVAL